MLCCNREEAITISVDDETYRLYQSRTNVTGVSVEEWAAERLTTLMPKSRAKLVLKVHGARGKKLSTLSVQRSPGSAPQTVLLAKSFTTAMRLADTNVLLWWYARRTTDGLRVINPFANLPQPA